MRIEGKKIADEILAELAVEVAQLKSSGAKTPHLAAVIVGSDGASETYVGAKVRACEKIGIASSLFHLPENTSEAELLKKIETINQDPSIDGFIVQLPLPKHIAEDKVINAIAPHKDVDGFHPQNVGRMVLNLPTYLPATPYGIIQLLERSNIDTIGKHCVVIGRSHIVGSPISILLSKNANPGNCTVTLAHSKTKNLADITLQADIIITAIGIPGFLKADMVKEKAVVIDVGITRIPSPASKSGYKIVGDVDFDAVSAKCAYITPVPGGVGPMTIISLLQNTIRACKKSIYN